jgi:FkbM family methyltransferase
MQKTSVGTMMFNPKDSTAGKSIDLYGEYMRDELELLKQVVRVGDYIVDAGAMYGGTALGLSKVVGDKGAVYSFEPQRVLHQILCSNFAMNGVFHAHCRHEALGASEGEVVVPALDVTKEGCHGCTTIDPTNYLGETVKMITVINQTRPTRKIDPHHKTWRRSTPNHAKPLRPIPISEPESRAPGGFP